MQVEEELRDQKKIVGRMIELGILFLAALLRIWWLHLKPIHFDEGINGWFVDQMNHLGYYRYDPSNYHGPLYFYLLFFSEHLLGVGVWALRLPSVLGSLLSVWVALRYAPFVGKAVARWAALFLAVSPGMIFYGRYAIHESWLVLATMVFLLGVLGLWMERSKKAIAMTALGVTLMLLLKETSFIHLMVAVIAWGVLFLWERFFPSRPALSQPPSQIDLRTITVALGCSFFFLFFFYSGTFLAINHFGAILKSLPAWMHTAHAGEGHIKTGYQWGFFNYYWLALMARYEGIFLLGLLYGVRLIWPSPAPLRYLAINTLGVLMVYTWIPYKTPWCLISIIWPLAFLTGGFIEEIATLKPLAFLGQGWQRRCWIGGGLTILSLLLAIRLNFFHYVDFKEPYVYVQTSPEINRLVLPLKERAKHDPSFFSTNGIILAKSYFPLPWLLRDFPEITYSRTIPAQVHADFVVIEASRAQQLEPHLKESYHREQFQLRDAMEPCFVYWKENPRAF